MWISGFILRSGRVAWVCGVLCFACAVPVALASAGSDRAAEAKAVVAEAVSKLSSILKDESASPDARRTQVSEVLAPWLDVPFITRSALGIHAVAFSRDQRTEFAREMERYLVATWLQRIARANLREFEVRDASWNEETQVAVVHTRGGRRIPTRAHRIGRIGSGAARVDYRLHQRDGAWRVRTIVIEGVDVLQLFRDQFTAVLRDGDPDALIRRLRELNERLEARNPFAALGASPARASFAVEHGAAIRLVSNRSEAICPACAARPGVRDLRSA